MFLEKQIKKAETSETFCARRTELDISFLTCPPKLMMSRKSTQSKSAFCCPALFKNETMPRFSTQQNVAGLSSQADTCRTFYL